MDKKPTKVSVVIPCRNEVGTIENCLKKIYNFDSPEGGFEVIVVDGMSDDGTADLLKILKDNEYPNLTVLENPDRTTPVAMNMGIKRAKGEFIVRTDVRCIHPKSYLKDLIELSEQTKADNVGGVLEPLGKTYVQKSIAAAYKSPIAMGGALRDRGDFIGETDAVYGGCFRRERLIEVGMYDESMVRNQDDELSFRLRKSGGKIMQSGKIKVQYYPRERYSQLFKQFLQYGYWKLAVAEKHPNQVSWRHYAPVAHVSTLLGLLILSPFNQHIFLSLLLYFAIYMLAISVESLRIAAANTLSLWPGIILSIMSIHMGFGIGFFVAVIKKIIGIEPSWVRSLSR